MVAESVNIIKETYVCIIMDRSYNGPVIIASPEGGVDIESVAEKTPEKIKKVPVDISKGIIKIVKLLLVPIYDKGFKQLDVSWQNVK